VSDPTITVVIPAYNGGALIGATLDSLAQQTFGDFEVVVIDDCSQDGTRDLIRGWSDRRVRLVEMTQNGGPVVARNRGVAEARGRYIAALDQDDLCRPERFARQVAYLDAHPDVVLLGTATEALYGERVAPMGYPERTTPMLLAWLLRIENPLVWSSVMIRGTAARSLTPFSRPHLKYAEDFDLYQRLSDIGPIARLDEKLMLYRQHEGGVSKRFADTMQANATRVLAERLRGDLGDGAAALAGLLIDYNMGRRAVPDRKTLLALSAGISALHDAFVTRHRPDPADAALIDRETAIRWQRICRAAVRGGTLTIADVAAATRPPMLRASLAPLVPSAAIGAVRRARQTLAA
jgi:glycosyltransferase involved in cell wall biosynthesis